jgi:diguanylate cyclase (GGDEF)-like protein
MSGDRHRLGRSGKTARLKTRPWYLIAVALVSVSCLVAYLLYDELRRSQEKAFADRVESISSTIARMGGYHIATFDWPLLNTLIEQAKRDPIVVSVQIEDFLADRKLGELDLAGAPDTRRFTRQILHEGSTVGFLTIVINETVLRHTLSWMRALLWVSIVTVMLLASGFIYVLIRKRYETELRRRANYDALTGLANRRLFQDRLEQAIRLAHRDGSAIGLLFVDIDHFKKVNDTLGHGAGDRILIDIASRIKHSVRSQDTIAKFAADDNLETIARLGGDEFTVILPGLRKPMNAEIVAERVIQACATTFSVDGQDLYLSASIGISIYPDDAQDAESIMQSADAAMYEAKESGRGVSRFYRSEMNATAQARLKLETELRTGFAQGELELFYQPLISTLSGGLVGAEALIRWRSPERGMVSPGDFIPLAEETGLIVPIGEWALCEACREAAGWQDLSGSLLYVAVNVSTMQFGQSNLAEAVSAVLRKNALPPECLKLEITESLLLQDSEGAQEVIQRISDSGVGFSIDDFGTGYSSLSYLRRYPFETLKIDRSFVSNVTESQSDASLVTSIIAMAASLDLKVVAEGIETDEQFEFVKNAGCDVAQGFRLGRPMSASDFALFIQKNAARVSRSYSGI